jgi:hypothetical protein
MAMLADGLQRAATRLGLEPERVDATFGVDAMRDWAARNRLTQIITADAPLGPVKDRLDVLAPALAASRFAAGGKRTGCTITYTPRVTPLGQAPVADLIAYSLSPESGPLPQEGWARTRREGKCDTRPVPQPLLRALPDFRKLPATPGVKD